MNKRVGIGKAHGKIILGGEHSVVYGMPAIVLPMPIEVSAISKSVHEGLEVEIFSKAFPKGDCQNHPDLEGYVQMVLFIKKTLKWDLPVQVEILSDIPIQSGLGSSAAVANAISESVISLIQGEAMPLLKNEAVAFAEKFAHGNPSGLDALGTQSFMPLLFQKGSLAPMSAPLKIKGTFYFVVALSGIYVSTKQVVENVGAYFSQNDSNKTFILNELSNIVNQMAVALDAGDAHTLGHWMTENHKTLKILGVSSKKLDEMVTLALSQGALGAKLSGKGIGGAVIALAKTKKDMLELMDFFQKNGSKQVYPLIIKDQKRNSNENKSIYRKSPCQHCFNQVLGKEG